MALLKNGLAHGLAIGVGMLIVGSCGLPIEPANSDNRVNRPLPDQESIFGPGGIPFLGRGRESEPTQAAGIGVNSFLWRASLDTIGFMPLASADPFGGVIITDWYSPPEKPGDRFKVTVFILDRRLRADGIRVAVFRQRRTAEGDWADTAVAETTARAVEDAILTGARQMRIAAIEQ